MKEVTLERFNKVLWPNVARTYDIGLVGWQVSIMHGVCKIALTHPGIQTLTGPTPDFLEDLRKRCLTIMGDWGFTPEELEWLDNEWIGVEQDAVQNMPGGAGQSGNKHI